MDTSVSPFAVITTVVSSQEIAQELSEKLVKERLVACAQFFPIDSIYSWKGKIEEDKEWLIQCKTIAANISAIEKFIGDIHPYDVPELIATPIIWTSKAYGKWIIESTQSVTF